MNHPTVSKINWTALIALLIGIAATMNWIPPELEEQLVELALMVLPPLIIVFRSWFTEPKKRKPVEFK